MDQQQLECNIQILEYLGWFIAEDETDEDLQGFDVILKCCRPDWSVFEKVAITDYLLSLYDEEDGSLEARLWFFSPKYSTSMDNLIDVIHEDSKALEWSVRRECYLDIWIFEAEIISLGFDDVDGEVYENSTHYGTSEISASMALSEAYLRCVGVYDG